MVLEQYTDQELAEIAASGAGPDLGAVSDEELERISAGGAAPDLGGMSDAELEEIAQSETVSLDTVRGDMRPTAPGPGTRGTQAPVREQETEKGTPLEGWAVEGVKDTARNVAEGFRKFAVYGYGGLSGAEYGMLKPVADAWDFYAEKAGLKDKDKQSAFTKFVEGIGEVARLTDEAAGPKVPGEGVPAAIARGVGALPVVVPTLGAMGARLGPHALAALGALQAAPSGDARKVAEAIAGGYAMHGGLRVAGALPKAAGVPVAGATFGAITAAEGGGLDEAIGSALLGGALAGRERAPSWKDFSEGVQADVRATAKQIGDSNWYRTLTIRERGLVAQDMQQRVAGLKAQGLTEGQILRTIKRVYGTDSPEFREMWGRVAVDSGRAGAGAGAPVPEAQAATPGPTPPSTPPSPPPSGRTATGVRLVTNQGAQVWRADSPLEPREKHGYGRWGWVDLDDPALVKAREAQQAIENQAQGRDRDRAASEIENERRVRQFTSRALLGSPFNDAGGPIFLGVPDPEVPQGAPLAGYGRLRTYESVYALPDTDPRKQEMLRMFAEDGANLAGMPAPADMGRPVLVRIAERFEGTTAKEYAAHSNHQVVQGFSDAELARTDAQLIVQKNLLRKLDVPESGDVMAASNRDFVGDFLQALGNPADLFDSLGAPGPKAANRIKRAVLTTLMTGDETSTQTITALTERAGDYGLQDVVNGLTAVAPRLAALRASKPVFDVSPHMAKVIPLMVEAKRAVLAGEAKTVEAYFAQADFYRSAPEELKEIAKILLRSKSAKEIRDIFGEYARMAEQEDVLTVDMFPGIKPQGMRQMLETAQRRVTGEERKGQGEGAGSAVDAASPGPGEGVGAAGQGRATRRTAGEQRATGTETAAGAAVGGKLDNAAAYDADRAQADDDLGAALSGVREPVEAWRGVEGKGESAFRHQLRLVAESRGVSSQPTNRPDILATRALQAKAVALLDALDAGRIDDAEALARWEKAQAEIARGQKRLEARLTGPAAETVDMFAPRGPGLGMLLEGGKPYGDDPDGKVIAAGVRAVLGATRGAEPTLEQVQAALARYGEKGVRYAERIHAAAVQAARTGSYDMEVALRQADAVQPAGTDVAPASPTRRRKDLKIAGARSMPTPENYLPAGRYEIDDDQALGVNLAIERFTKGGRGMMLADGTGMGKTRQALVLAEEWGKRSGKPVLIVTGSYENLMDTYRTDAKALGIDLGALHVATYTSIRGDAPRRYVNVLTQGKHQTDISGEYGLVIFDEAHALKNDDSRQRLAAMRLSVGADHIAYLTATPMDRPVSAAYFMAEITGLPRTEIARMLGFQIVQDTLPSGKIVERVVPVEGVSGQAIHENLLKLREVAIRHGALVRREYPFLGTFERRELEMPEQMRKDQADLNRYYDGILRRVPMKAWELRARVNQERTHALNNWSEEHKVDAAMVEVRASLAAGRRPVIVCEYTEPSARMERPEAKFDPATGRQTWYSRVKQEEWDRVFGERKPLTINGTASVIARALEKANIPFARIYGTRDKVAQQALFQNGKVPVVVLSVKSGGQSINLDDTAGDAPRDQIFLGWGFAGDTVQQAVGRISRRNTASQGRAIFLYFNGGLADATRRRITTAKVETLQRIQQGEDLDAATWEPNEAGVRIADADEALGPDLADTEGLETAPADMALGEGYVARLTPAGYWELKTPDGKTRRLDLNNPEHQRLVDKLSGGGSVREGEQMFLAGLGADEQQLFLDFKKELFTDEDKATQEATLSAEERDLQDAAESGAAATLWRSRTRVLGNALAAEYRRAGQISLIGQPVSSAEDLAVVAQIARNPSFETVRYVVVASGKVVFESAVTSRMPGFSQTTPGRFKASEQVQRELADKTFLDELAAAAQAHGGEVWMLHNHPNGQTNGSNEDRQFTWAFTREMNARGVTMRGHVVIDHGKYALIEAANQTGNNPMVAEAAGVTIPARRLQGAPQQYRLDVPTLAHDLLGARVVSVEDLARFGMALSAEMRPDDFAVITTAHGKVKGIMTVPVEALKADAVVLFARLRQFMRDTGGIDAFAVNVTPGTDTNGVLAMAVRTKALTDVHEKNEVMGVSYRNTGRANPVGELEYGMDGVRGYRVAEGVEDDVLYLAKRIIGATPAEPGDLIAQMNEEADAAARGLGVARLPWAADRPLNGGTLESADPVVEGKFQEAEQNRKDPLWTRITDGIRQLARQATRPYADLNTGRGRVRALLDETQVLSEASRALAKYQMYAVVNGLDRTRYRLFQRLLTALDLKRDIEAGLYDEGRALPFWGTRDKWQADLDRWSALAEQNPEVNLALERRRELWRGVRTSLIEIKKLDESHRNDDDYVHHKVLAYLDEAAAGLRGGDLAKRRRGWQKGRLGSDELYVVDYLEAEYEVLSEALHDIRQAALREQMRAAAPDRTRELRGVAKHQNEVALLGGEANWRMAQDLRNRMRYIREQARASGEPLDDVERQTLSDLSKELWGLDPTMPFRMRKAAALDRLKRAIGIEQDEELVDADEDLMGQLAMWANGTEGELAIPARAFFKAIQDQARFTKETLKDRYITGAQGNERIDRRIVPAGHARVQITRGNAFYRTKTITEQALEAVLAGQKQLEDAVRDGVAMGGVADEWVIPEDVAAQLDTLQARRQPERGIGKLSAAIMHGWKWWQLFSPPRVVKYNLNNMVGDNDFVLGVEPRVYGEIGLATRDAWRFHMKRRGPTGDMLTMMRMGVINAGQVPRELAEIREDEYFDLVTGNRTGLGRKYMNLTTNVSKAREDVLRIAAFRYYRKAMAAGRPPWELHHAAPWQEVEDLWAARLEDPEALDRLAALMANSALINYATPTPLGAHLRVHLIPFYRWMEGNAGRYWQYLANEVHAGRENSSRRRLFGVAAVGRVLRYGALVGVLSAVVAAWNRLRYPDEDETMRRSGRRGYLILGRNPDGKVRAVTVQGAWRDLLSAVGIGNPLAIAEDVVRGRKTVGEVASDAAWGLPNRVMQGVAPWYKLPAELASRQSLYPDVRRPVPIRDRAEYLAGQAALRTLYGTVTGKPMPAELRGWRGVVQSWVVQYTDPGEAQYWMARHDALRWAKDHRLGASQAIVIGERGNAMYYWKQALRYGDRDAARRWRAEYQRAGGTAQGMMSAIAEAHPLSALPRAAWNAYAADLKGEKRQTLQGAVKWWMDVYSGRKVRRDGNETGGSRSHGASGGVVAVGAL